MYMFVPLWLALFCWKSCGVMIPFAVAAGTSAATGTCDGLALNGASGAGRPVARRNRSWPWLKDWVGQTDRRFRKERSV